MATTCCTEKTERIFMEVKIMICIVTAILVLLGQGAILDYYLISNNSDDSSQYAWIVLDVVVLIVWSIALIRSYVYYRRQSVTVTDGVMMNVTKNLGILKSIIMDELRYSYLCWFVYVCCLVPRVVVIFKTIAEGLTEDQSFGPNTLKLTISLAAIIFLFLVFTHNDAKPNTARLHYIGFLTGSVTFNILDSCEILDMLFITETGILLTFQMENVILSFACINFFLPILALVELRMTSEEGKTTAKWFKFSYILSHIFLTNLPYLIIRSFLWHGRNAGVSTYLTKNLIMLVLAVNELISHFGSYKLKVCKFCKHFYFLDKFMHTHNLCQSCETQHKGTEDVGSDDEADDGADDGATFAMVGLNKSDNGSAPDDKGMRV